MSHTTVLSVEEHNEKLLSEAEWLLEGVIVPNLDTSRFTLEDIQDDTRLSRRKRMGQLTASTVYSNEHLEVLVDRGCITDNEDGTFSILRTDWDLDGVIDKWADEY